MLYAELDAFEPVAIHEHETGDGWRVFFRTAAQRDAAWATLASEFGNALLDLAPLDVDDEDWARRSQASLTAIRAGRIIVAPPWDLQSLIPDPSSLIIIIDPSMGFGTGHHATTRLCLELLQQVDLRAKRVIDVGTGSGVLAIAAWALGASSVAAIDHDPDALQNARENAERNGATGAIEILEVEISRVSLPPADLVCANLTGAVLQRYADQLRRLVAPSGMLIVSGFSGDELADVALAFHCASQHSLREAEWCAALYVI